MKETGEVSPVIIVESFASLKEMSVSDAVRKLDVSKAPVVIFRRTGDGDASIVHRCPDGNIGWIETAIPSQTLRPIAAKPKQQPEESARAFPFRL